LPASACRPTAAFGLSVWRARDRAVETYGSAGWAKPAEVRRAGLLGSDGVVLGRYRGANLRHDEPEHMLCFAPTRSGKGVGLVVPSLLIWPVSAIVHDIKGENWTLTAGFRARHSRVLLFDPTSSASAAYNPLLEVRKGEWEVRDIQNVVDILVDPEGSPGRRNHWEKTSHSIGQYVLRSWSLVNMTTTAERKKAALQAARGQDQDFRRSRFPPAILG
jgi:type IV secretion system protein VirD4